VQNQRGPATVIGTLTTRRHCSIARMGRCSEINP